jgi:hypothetical protein
MKRNKWNWDVILVWIVIAATSFTLWYNIINLFTK